MVTFLHALPAEAREGYVLFCGTPEQVLKFLGSEKQPVGPIGENTDLADKYTFPDGSFALVGVRGLSFLAQRHVCAERWYRERGNTPVETPTRRPSR